MMNLKNKSPERPDPAEDPEARFSQAELSKVVEACRSLPPAQGDYRADDYVLNLIITVLDFRMHAGVLNKALDHFCLGPGRRIVTHRQLAEHLDAFPESKQGGADLALSLWGYRYWTRAALLRKLLGYFDQRSIRDLEALRRWARGADFERDFRGRIPGLGYAVFQWLIMRLGVEAVKPDTHLKHFLMQTAGRKFGDGDASALLLEAARQLAMPALDFDTRLWESVRRQKGRRGGGEVKYLGRNRERH